MKHSIACATILAVFGGVACSSSNAKPSADGGKAATAKAEPMTETQPMPKTKTRTMTTTKTVSASDYTSAPLQHTLALELEATPEEVWALISDHEALPTFFPLINKVTVDNSSAASPGGVGAVRSCSLGEMQLTESVRVFEPGEAFGYSVVKGGMPGVTNHLGLITLSPKGTTTVVRWETYFDHPEPMAVTAQIGKLLSVAGDGLVKKFGGKIVAV